MKKLVAAVAICGLLIVTVFPSCKILDVTETFDLDIVLIVDESGASFNETVILDAVEQSSDIEEYQDLLKEIEIEKVVVTLTSFNGSPTQTMTATLDVMDLEGNGVATLGTVSDVNLQDLTINSMEIPLNQEGVDRLQELILDSPHAAKFQYYGTGNEAPLDFTAKFIITVKMTANPLD